MDIGNRLVTCSEHAEEKVMAFLPSGDRLGRVCEKNPVCVISEIKGRKAGSTPIVVPVGHKEIGARRDGHMFVALNARVFVPIVNDVMPALL